MEYTFLKSTFYSRDTYTGAHSTAHILVGRVYKSATYRASPMCSLRKKESNLWPQRTHFGVSLGSETAKQTRDTSLPRQHLCLRICQSHQPPHLMPVRLTTRLLMQKTRLC